MTASIDELALTARVGEVLNRWPVAGLAVGVIRHGSLAWFHGHGVADVTSGTPVDQDTVFRIASVTKTITAIAVMQLQEQGMVDLDAPLSRYLREHVFGPLGMDHSDLVRSERVRPRLATGYQLGSRGLKAVTDREVVQAGAGAVYSTTRDMARYTAALLGGGANARGRVLRPETLATMFQPHYQPDPRIPGMGLAFFRSYAGEHQTVGHDGIWTGFHSALLLVPGQGAGVVAFANTGPFSPLAGPGRSPMRSCAACSISPTTPCAPASRSNPRLGATCAAGTPSDRACSPTPSPGTGHGCGCATGGPRRGRPGRRYGWA